MQKTFESNLFTRELMKHEQVECLWCEAAVPVPAGDEIGVCIECGAVVFRDQAEMARMGRLSVSRSHYDVPTPA